MSCSHRPHLCTGATTVCDQNHDVIDVAPIHHHHSTHVHRPVADTRLLLLGARGRAYLLRVRVQRCLPVTPWQAALIVASRLGCGIGDCNLTQVDRSALALLPLSKSAREALLVPIRTPAVRP